MAIMKKRAATRPAPHIGQSTPSVTATEAKNEFARVLERVIRGGVLFITKHGTAKAVLMPVEEYDTLSRAGEMRLNSLTEEFDELLLRMQTPKARKAVKTAFHASPKQLGKAAAAAVRSRG
jgi:antitoxin Phd